MCMCMWLHLHGMCAAWCAHDAPSILVEVRTSGHTRLQPRHTRSQASLVEVNTNGYMIGNLHKDFFSLHDEQRAIMRLMGGNGYPRHVVSSWLVVVVVEVVVEVVEVGVGVVVVVVVASSHHAGVSVASQPGHVDVRLQARQVP